VKHFDGGSDLNDGMTKRRGFVFFTFDGYLGQANARV